VIVTRPEELEQLVEEYSRFDTVVYDLETMYVATPDEQGEFDRIHEQPKRLWTPDDKAWVDVFKLKATDPLCNTTIWFGMATAGRSDAVATGHPQGSLITPAHKEITTAAEYFGEDDERAYTGTGKLSYRKVEVNMPATFGRPPEQLSIEEACEILRPLFFDPNRRVVNQNLKFDIKSLVRHFDGEFIPGPHGDTMIAQHLVDENAFMQLQLGKMVERHLGHTYDKLGSKGVHNFSFEQAARYAEQDARFTWLLWKKYERILQKDGLMDLLEFEMEVMELLMRKEYDGAYVDRKSMDATRITYERRKESTVAELRSDYLVPPSCNFDSSPQKADLLYTQLKAPVLKKTPGGQPSTDAETLEKLVEENSGEASEVAQLLLDYAETSKVIGTYFVGMGAKLDHFGYLHPDFTQHVADTNRLSCREPNVHNIPRESDMRDMFVAPPGMVVIGADYDQIELRFICSEAEDTTMQEVFLSGEDVHATTAALVMNKPLDEVTSEERTTHGKMPNFLIGYGGTAFLLSVKTGISVEEAEAVFKAYFSRFSRINPWKSEVYREALDRAVFADGNLVVPPYVQTMMGYRRRLPELLVNPKSAGGNRKRWKELNKIKSRAERQAVNSITQGSAAETLKIAMLDIERHCKKDKFPMRLALNIHDEVVAYCDERHSDEGLEIVETMMANVVNPFTGEPPLRGYIPLLASGYISDRWQKG
jgi:DNA polymerase-1